MLAIELEVYRYSQTVLMTCYCDMLGHRVYRQQFKEMPSTLVHGNNCAMELLWSPNNATKYEFRLKHLLQLVICG